MPNILFKTMGVYLLVEILIHYTILVAKIEETGSIFYLVSNIIWYYIQK